MERSGRAVSPREAPLLELRLAEPRRDLAAATARIQLFLAPFALAREVLYSVELIVEETVMNVLMHAFSDGAPHAIELAVQVEPAEIVLQLRDGGMAFDPTRYTPPQPPTSLEAAEPGGLGLVLVKRHAKSMHYARTDGINQLTLTVARA